MIKNKKLLPKIKQLVYLAEPSATVILFGSQARGQGNKQSDIDILILVDNDKITYADEQRIKYPLYDLEFETGKIQLDNQAKEYLNTPLFAHRYK